MKALYHLGIYMYLCAIYLSIPFNRKAKLWYQGRRGWKKQMESLDANDWIWFHCASMGEFEQGRPLLEALHKTYPEYRLMLTFFSPSGFLAREGYEGVDHVMYMPADTTSNARFFVGKLKPKLAVFVKYEFWLNHLNMLHEQQVPTFVISATFRPGQIFFTWYGKIFRNALSNMECIFVQEENSLQLLAKAGIDNAIASGDTRYDRVIQISHTAFSDDAIEDFCRTHPIFIAGSTWPSDEALLGKLMTDEMGRRYRYILAPHEVDQKGILQLRQKLPLPSVLHSAYNGDDGNSVMIIDSIGLLSALYRFGDVCYVGGGFGSGIHNILEAAVYGKPVIFGPACGKFREALELMTCGGGFAVRGQADLMNVMRLLQDPAVLKMAGTMSQTHVAGKGGATNNILSVISERARLIP